MSKKTLEAAMRLMEAKAEDGSYSAVVWMHGSDANILVVKGFETCKLHDGFYYVSWKNGKRAEPNRLREISNRAHIN